MIRSRNGVIRPAAERADNEERQPLPRVEAPPITPPVYYNPIIQQQAEIDSLLQQNQEQQRLLELQDREHQRFRDEYNAIIAALRLEHQTRIDDLNSDSVRLTNENQELRRLLELQDREHQQLRNEYNATIPALRLEHQTIVDDLRSADTRLTRANQEQRRLLELHTIEHQQFKDETNTAVAVLLDDQQTKKQAISFLYDRFKEVSVVAFSTGNCAVHGEKLPIPVGFEKQHCKFFTGGQGKFRHGGTGDVVSVFQTEDSMVLPYGGNCELSAGAYGVWAAKSVISEQEIADKKTEYRLIP